MFFKATPTPDLMFFISLISFWLLSAFTQNQELTVGTEKLIGHFVYLTAGI